MTALVLVLPTHRSFVAADEPAEPELGGETIPVAIVIQGQDAVSTNFAPEPVQLFGAGGNLTLQLNQPSLLSDTAYYADFVFTVDAPGAYAIWYGGSPPASSDPLQSSYGSPFDIVINDDEPLNVTAETVRAGPIYSVPYRWFKAEFVTLEAGEHRMRVIVDQRRRYDSRYFLYLDRFILVPDGASHADLPDQDELQDEVPTIEDLLILLRDNPTNLDGYVQLANLYSLVGDHINALRYLGRAQILDAGNPEVLQAVARNTLWRGDIDGALGAYWSLVSAAPGRLETFLEAGKIAAWSGFLGASEQYYLAGLSHHPENPLLLVNLGFTYLWWNRPDRAREFFDRAERTARSPEAMLELGAEYRINDDFGREAALYREGLRRFPQSVEIAERLLSALLRQGIAAEAADHRRITEQRLPESADRMERVVRRLQLRDEVISGYEMAVRENPDNLVYRAELAQTFFWIGRRSEGIRVFRNLLAAQTQQSLHGQWSDVEPYGWNALYNALTQFVIRSYLGQIASDTTTLATALQTYRTLENQEGADLAPSRGAITAAAARLTDSIRVVESARNLYAGDITPQMEEARSLDDERSAEIAAIRERLLWDPPVPVITAELNQAGDVIGNRRTGQLLTGLAGIGVELPSLAELNLLIGDGDERTLRGLRNEIPVHMALTARQSGNAAAARTWFGLEDFVVGFGDESVSRPFLVFTELLREPIRSLLGETDSAPPTPQPFNADAAEQLVESARELSGELAIQLRTLEQDGRLFQSILQQSTELALFYMQTNSAPERNRLGELLIDEDDLSGAIVQLELVRAVDPDNLATLYILAQAYRRQGQWRQAQSLLAHIHQRDSTFRNTIALHNEIARQHADDFHGSTSIITEPQRIDMRTTMEYLWRVNSRFSIRGVLETGSVRTKIPDFVEKTDITPEFGFLRRASYQDYAARVGIPLYLRPDRFTLEPVLGVRMYAHNLFYGTRDGSVTADVWDGADLFGSYRVEPEPGLRWTLTGRELFLSGSYRFAPYASVQDTPLQTTQQNRPGIRAHTLRSDLSWNLQARPNPIWSRYSQRTGGAGELITADNQTEGVRYRVSQEFRYGIIRRSEPFTRLGVTAVAEFEDYQGEKSPWFYRPDRIFDTGLRVDWQAYRPIGTEMTWGVSGSVYGGYYQTRLGDDQDDPAIRAVGRLTGELSRRNVSFQLGVSGSRVVGSGNIGKFPDDGGYYDLGLTFAVVGRNFGLLTR